MSVDLTQLGIDTLMSVGTDRAVALAAEIDRGRSRAAERTMPATHRDPSRLPADREATHEARETMLRYLRPAQPWEWTHWVTAYRHTHGDARLRRYAYPTANARFYVALTDVAVVPLYGAWALNIIVPAGIRDDGGDTGHTNLYGYGESRNAVTYRGFQNNCCPYFVPVYTDTDV